MADGTAGSRGRERRHKARRASIRARKSAAAARGVGRGPSGGPRPSKPGSIGGVSPEKFKELPPSVQEGLKLQEKFGAVIGSKVFVKKDSQGRTVEKQTITPGGTRVKLQRTAQGTRLTSTSRSGVTTVLRDPSKAKIARLTGANRQAGAMERQQRAQSIALRANGSTARDIVLEARKMARGNTAEEFRQVQRLSALEEIKNVRVGDISTKAMLDKEAQRIALLTDLKKSSVRRILINKKAELEKNIGKINPAGGVVGLPSLSKIDKNTRKVLEFLNIDPTKTLSAVQSIERALETTTLKKEQVGVLTSTRKVGVISTVINKITRGRDKIFRELRIDPTMIEGSLRGLEKQRQKRLKETEDKPLPRTLQRISDPLLISAGIVRGVAGVGALVLKPVETGREFISALLRPRQTVTSLSQEFVKDPSGTLVEFATFSRLLRPITSQGKVTQQQAKVQGSLYKQHLKKQLTPREFKKLQKQIPKELRDIMDRQVSVFEVTPSTAAEARAIRKAAVSKEALVFKKKVKGKERTFIATANTSALSRKILSNISKKRRKSYKINSENNSVIHTGTRQNILRRASVKDILPKRSKISIQRLKRKSKAAESLEKVSRARRKVLKRRAEGLPPKKIKGKKFKKAKKLRRTPAEAVAQLRKEALRKRKQELKRLARERRILRKAPEIEKIFTKAALEANILKDKFMPLKDAIVVRGPSGEKIVIERIAKRAKPKPKPKGDVKVTAPSRTVTASGDQLLVQKFKTVQETKLRTVQKTVQKAKTKQKLKQEKKKVTKLKQDLKQDLRKKTGLKSKSVFKAAARSLLILAISVDQQIKQKLKQTPVQEAAQRPKQVEKQKVRQEIKIKQKQKLEQRIKQKLNQKLLLRRKLIQKQKQRLILREKKLKLKRDEKKKSKQLDDVAKKVSAKKTFIYFPDVYSQVFGVKASVKEKKELLKKGRVFSGLDIRKLL